MSDLESHVQQNEAPQKLCIVPELSNSSHEGESDGNKHSVCESADDLCDNTQLDSSKESDTKLNRESCESVLSDSGDNFDKCRNIPSVTHDDIDSNFQQNSGIQPSLPNSELCLSEKNSPNSSKVTGADLDSPASTTEPPSMPSDKSDSHGTCEGRCPESSGLEFDDEFSYGNIDSERKVESYLGDSKESKLSVESKEQESPMDGESMSNLDCTIDSVLEKIRTGREMEVDFDPTIRQQVLNQVKLLSSTEKLTVQTSDDMFTNQVKSPRMSSNSPREESNSAYLAQRQRMQTALNQASTYFGMHSDHCHPNERMFYKHRMSYQQGYAPNVSPHLSSMRLPRSQYSPPFQYGGYSSAYHMSGQKNYSQRYQPMSPQYSPHYAHYSNPNHLSMSQYYSSYNQSQSQAMHPYSHSNSTYPSPIPQTMQSYPPCPTSANNNLISPMMKMQDMSSMSGSQLRSMQMQSFNRNYCSPLQQDSVSPRCDIPGQSRMSSSPGGVVSPNVRSADPKHDKQLMDSSDVSHFSFHDSSTPNSHAQLMPPPSNSMPVSGKKRKKIHSPVLGDMKRRKFNKGRDNYDQQSYSNELFFQNAVKRLSLNNYTQLLQDPLVYPSLSMVPPLGGQNLGNVVNGHEAEGKSVVHENLPGKYSLFPFSPKLPRPKVIDSFPDRYVYENCSTINFPCFPVMQYEDSATSECLIESPVCQTPDPADSLSSTPLLSQLNDEIDLESDRSTPPLSTTDDFKKNIHWAAVDTPSGCSSSNSLKYEKVNYVVQSITCPITITNAQGKLVTALLVSDQDLVAANSLIKQIFEAGSSSEVRHSRGRPPLSSIRDRRFPEEGLTIASLISSQKRTCCDSCEMAIIGNKCVRPDENLPHMSEKVFCSVHCLSKYSKLSNEFVFMRQNSDSVLSGKSSLKRKLTFNRNKRKSPYDHMNLMKPHFKRWQDIRWKMCGPEPGPLKFYKEESSMKAKHILARYSQQILAHEENKDSRICVLCKSRGDARERVASRLLNLNIDKWIHLNCALWCFDVYETVCGALVDVEISVNKALKTMCVYCGQYGAGITCYRSRCPAIYHVPCAHAAKCMFFTDRGMYCPVHKIKDHPLHLSKLTAKRRVYINRDESDQVGKVVLDDNVSNQKTITLRVGSLILHQIGQLLPEQIASGDFNTNNCIYPVGFHTTRFYWSSRQLKRRCLYRCRILEKMGKPVFMVSVEEEGYSIETRESDTCFGAWEAFLNRISDLRNDNKVIKLFPDKLRGEDLFGLCESHIVRAIESLPGVDALKNYAFKFGRLQLIKEMPLAINPTGCVRSEPKLRTYVRSRALHSVVTRQVACTANASSSSFSVAQPGEPFSGYSRLLITGKTQQYRRLKTEWKNNVVFGRSRIQGLGLFAARDLEKYTIIIEYLGELIRNEVANRRELMYEAQNRGVYMFRVDEHLIVDATMCGGLARYINHSCDPNCSAEIINFDGSSHIVILAKRKLEKGEELTYDYNFDFEDCSNKIPCLCGAAACRKWMN